MNLFHLLSGNTALVLSVIASGLASPFLSALLTKAPSFLTGALTTLIATASAFIAEWQANPNHFDWKQAASTALAGWLVALAVQKGWLAGTPTQMKLHATGPQLGAANPPAATG
jgi:hypothetical protein